MAYTVNHTDVANKGSITVEDNTINQQTSLSLPGRNTTAYGTAIAENFLHLLENFANTTAPNNPTEGQLWYDNTAGVDQLKLYDGTTWISASGLKKATTAPGAAQSVTGDLWVDTDNQQLYLYTGSGWVLVGPTFSDGLSTGVKPESIVGTNNVSYTCLVIEISAKTLAIYSTAAFTPKTTIAGFTTINPGFNLSSADITGAGAGKYYGTAEKAEALVINNESIPATNFMRNDSTSQSLYPITVKNNGGITVGASSFFTMGVEGQAGIISHQTSGSNIDVRVNNNGSATTVMRIDSTAKVGINNLSPDQALDVTGNIQLSNSLLVDGTTDASTISTGSIITKGGVGIAKKLFVGSDTNLSGLTTTANIVPNANTSRNLGTANEQWLNVYAQNLIGNLTGNVTGTVSGRSGSTDKLASSTTFQMNGDVTAPSFTFDGQDASSKTFTTTISNTFVANKTEVASSLSTDEILINRVTGDTGVYKVSRTNLFKAIPTLPIGMISPFGGDTAPVDWVLCYGQEVTIATYQNLFNVIGYNFKDQSLVAAGKFALPDLRGRFPLGKDNMGGGSANVVTSAAADTMGSVEGQQNQTIAINNLPEHEHDLRGPSGDQYYTLRDVTGTPNDAQGIQYDAPTGTGAGQAYPTSGGVLTNNALGTAIDVMNPYMTVNYIIYAGENTAI
jgi:microcystin-dependent protein/cytoskeletal protein CcmA (bactofilin family)